MPRELTPPAPSDVNYESNYGRIIVTTFALIGIASLGCLFGYIISLAL